MAIGPALVLGALVGLLHTSIYVLIGDGRLEVFKLGRRTLVKADSVRRLIDGQG